MTASLVVGTPRTALSNSDEWQTPRRLFNACVDHYGPFAYDAFAARWNALCAKFGTKRASALRCRWPTGTWWPSFSVEVVFVEGRLRFRHESGVQDSARHPSAVVVFSR